MPNKEMGDSEKLQLHKQHHAAHSGRKAEKKKSKNPHIQDLNAKQRNPKAFAIQSVNKAERRFRRTMDIKSKGYHIPTVDHTPAKPPPAIVALVGPPKVGKTTLLKCLIKNFTRQKMTDIRGPITLVSGKKKRITFIECNNDINNMIDIAKIADLVLLLIDAKSGFEMETFEFLNICQVHGMPRLMGVLTHLDLFKHKKSLQKTKTFLKKRYRTEIPKGEKMFYLSGLLHGEYLKNEIHNLGRFISVMKYEHSSWKKTHPFVLADRLEDITDPEILSKNPVCNRTVCLYGYARGGALKKNSFYHIPGCGDYLIKSIHYLPDPCPLPDKKKKRSLNEKERLIYAPLCGVGGIVYDKDAVYIELKNDQISQKNAEEKPSDKLVNSIITSQHPIDEKMKISQVQLFADDAPVQDDDVSSSEEDDDKEVLHDKNSMTDNENISVNEDNLSYKDESEHEEENYEFSDDSTEESSDTNSTNGKRMKNSPVKNKRKKFKSNIENESDEEIGNVKWKNNLIKRATDDFYQRQKEVLNLQKLVYGQKQSQLEENLDSNTDSDDEIGGLFHLAKCEKEKKETQKDNGFDCSKFIISVPRDWSNENELDSIKDCFVTGKWDDNEDGENLLANDDELYGDFEDYEAGIVHKAKGTESDNTAESENETKDENLKTQVDKEKSLHEKRLEKKKKLKELFNQEFDEKEGKTYYDELKMEADAQGELNKKEFEEMEDEERIHYEGYRPGLYLRLEIEEMPCEFVKYFDPSYPIIIGSLLKGEDKMGYLQIRIKKHRWYPKILKSRDPLIMSLGWRRFQSIVLYYITDHNGRNRQLKYTPKHLHCMAAFWGPITQQKSGIVAVQSVSEIKSDFRIAAIGTVTEVNQVTNIVKKLKLIGTPYEIFKKTAFIQGMFHSPNEVTKYEGAAIRTVSGIRGQIKKAVMKPPGLFRATFEDKILPSDIVFLRTWVTVTIPKFCISVTSLLMPPNQKSKWEGVRTLGKLRYDKGLHAPVNEDSEYIPIERKLKQFAPLIVPKTLQKNLPFRAKIVHQPNKKKDPENERIAVIREPREREISKALSMLKTVHKLKMKKENKAMWLRAREHRKQKRKEEALHHKRVQEMKKRILRKKSNKVPGS